MFHIKLKRKKITLKIKIGRLEISEDELERYLKFVSYDQTFINAVALNNYLLLTNDNLEKPKDVISFLLKSLSFRNRQELLNSFHCELKRRLNAGLITNEDKKDIIQKLPFDNNLVNTFSRIQYSIYCFIKKVIGKKEDFSSFYNNKKCNHGIKGGYIMERCPLCVEQIKQKALIDIEDSKRRQKQQRIDEIKEKAKEIKFQEQKRIEQYNQGKIDNVLQLSPNDFEGFIANLYRKLGYNVIQTQATNDQGRDLILKKDGKKYLVECKKYMEGNKVGRPEMQKFYAAIEHDKAVSGIMVTTSDFTDCVKFHTFVQNGKIELVDRNKLLKMIKEHFPQDDELHFKNVCLECGDIVVQKFEEEAICNNGHILAPQKMSEYLFDKGENRKKNCPECNKKLKVINWEGRKFIGCTGYPKCNYTRKYEKGIFKVNN